MISDKIGACPVLESDFFPFGMYVEVVSDGQDRVPHGHEYINLIYVKAGEGLHFYNGRTFNISRGDVFIVEPNKEHYYIAIPGKTMEVYGVQFRPELLRNELEALTKVSPFFDFFYMEPFFRETFDFSMKLTLNQGDQIEFLLMLELLYEESRQKRLGYRLMIQTKLLSMFIYLSRCYDNLDKTADFSSLKDSEIIDRICEFIQKHHAQPLTLQQISRLCGMSQSTFTHRFKEIKGMTFLEYRNQIRCEVARDLLSKTNHKIISIAQEVGFEDVSNFNKTFKHLVGSSPGEFRKKAALELHPLG